VEFDFLVIGGGIAGVSAGARLARLGSVVLVEAEAGLGFHASGRSASLFEERYGSPTVVALNRARSAFLHSEYGGVLTPRGLMLVGLPPQRAALERESVQMGMALISAEEARKLVPILTDEASGCAAYHAETWDIDTDRLIQNFARAIRENGQTETGLRVEAVARVQGGWEVNAGKRTITARKLVNAAGAWADQVARLAGISPFGLTPLRRSMARIPAPAGQDTRDWPMMLGVGERWYAKPDAGALLVSPAEEEPCQPMDAWADDMTIAEGLARYEDHVSAPVTRVLSTWAGLRTFAPDRCLVLGPDPGEPDFIWVAGQGGFGFHTAPAASQLVADLVAGRTPDLDSGIVNRLTPERLR